MQQYSAVVGHYIYLLFPTIMGDNKIHITKGNLNAVVILFSADLICLEADKTKLIRCNYYLNICISSDKYSQGRTVVGKGIYLSLAALLAVLSLT